MHRQGATSWLKQLDVDALRQFRATWPDGPLSAYKNLERLRAFFWFCHRSDWIEKNPAVGLKPPKLPDESEKVRVFTPEQIKKLLDACDGPRNATLTATTTAPA